jgi:T5SS/PEP-CTERM-associated repeat protein
MSGFTFTWVASSAADWSVAADWSPATVPGAGAYVLLANGRANQVSVTTNQAASILNMQAGTVTVQGATLAVGMDGLLDNATLDVIAAGSLDLGAAEPAGTADLVVGNLSGTVGQLLVDGAGARIASAQEIIAGNDGSGTITVANGASLAISDTYSAITLGAQSGASGAFLVTGDAQATTVGIIYDGYAGVGSLSVTGGAVLTSSASNQDNIAATIGNQAGSTGSSALVSDAGSTWTMDGGLTVLGASTLEVLNGGTLVSTAPAASGIFTVSVGNAVVSPADVGVILVQGAAGAAHSVLNAGTGSIGVGYDATGVLFVTQGGQVTATAPSGDTTAMLLGGTTGGAGFLVLSDPGSAVRLTGQLLVGLDGYGSAMVKNAATLSTGNLGGSAGIVLGNSVGSQGVMTVTGAGSAVTNTLGRLSVGNDGSGTLEILDGAVVASLRTTSVGGALSVANGSGGNGTMVVSGTGSRFQATGNAYIADYDTGSLWVQAGGSLAISGEVDIGNGTGAVGVLEADGAGSSVSVGGNLFLGLDTVNGALGAGFLQVNDGARAAIAGSAVLDGYAVVQVDGTGAIEIGGTTDSLAGGVVQIDAGATLSGQGTITGDIVDLGLIDANAGGTLNLQAAAGNYSVSGGSTLLLQYDTTGTVDVAFGASGSSANTLQLEGSEAVRAGAGAGVIDTSFDESELIYAGNDNTVVANAISSFDLTSTATDTVVGGAGAETVAVVGSGFGIAAALLFCGQGTMDVTALGDGSTVVGGTHSVTLQGASGGGEVFGSTVGGNLMQTGTGQTTLVGGGNGDLLQATNAAADLLVATTGSETLDASASSGNVTLLAGSGSDSLAGGAGSDLMLAGTGNATMSAGSGPDVFGFAQGNAGGNDTISGFDPSQDLVDLFGYPAGEGATALSQASVVHGSLVLTLSDDTHVTFLGETSLPGASIIG